MTSIKLLEDRVADLEEQILGVEKIVTFNNVPVAKSSVIDNLLNANTLISSALSSREKANSLVKRLSELNTYLDPNFDDLDLQTEAKIELILALEPEVRENLQLLSKLKELMPVLEMEHICNVPELANKFNSLTLSYLKAYEDSEALNVEVRQVFSKYNAVITCISKSLITLDVAVIAAEIAAAPPKQAD